LVVFLLQLVAFCFVCGGRFSLFLCMLGGLGGGLGATF